jgi:cytochrome oxidase assembly protein ShyY1
VTRRGGDIARPSAAGALAKPAAVYDTVTEGLTGSQFLFTGRWVAFIAAAIVFAIVCSMLALWQLDRGRQASADNAVISANFDATPVPITRALPALDSFTADQNWQRVSASGTYEADEQLFVRNRFHGGDVGFEVLTPLRLADGTKIIVDRGWIAAAAGNPGVPARTAAPPDGPIDVVARLRASEAPRGAAGGPADQIQSVDLATVKDRIGGTVYTGAYGVLDTQSAAASGLKKVQATPPAEGVGFHYSYMIQWFLFALIGFGILARAIRNEFRRLNADDPDERARAAERLKKQAGKPFTDEETEDEAIDGYLPLTRWGFGAGTLSPPSGPPPRALDGGRGQLETQPRETDVFVIDPDEPPSSDPDDPVEDAGDRSP